MTILDANILLYAYDEAAPQNAKTKSWLKGRVENYELIGLPWVSLWAFLRIATNARIQRNPLSLDKAFEKIENMQQLPGATILQPGPRHAEILRRVAGAGMANGPRMTDAVLVALAVEHGATLASTDLDFARFKDVRWVNPLD